MELAPEVAVFHNNLGIALERAGYFGAAVAAYRRALETDSSHTRAVANLARLEQRPDATTVEVEVATFPPSRFNPLSAGASAGAPPDT